MIDSTAAFHAVIGAAVSAAFVEVIDKAYKELQDVMRSEVYGAYSPTDYARTEGLLTSWKKQVLVVLMQNYGLNHLCLP